MHWHNIVHSPCTDARCRRPADLQKEFADNYAKDQHRDQVCYRRLRCKGWCINWHCWWSHAWWLLRRWRCRVRWRGTGNLAQSDAFLLDMHLNTSVRRGISFGITLDLTIYNGVCFVYVVITWWPHLGTFKTTTHRPCCKNEDATNSAMITQANSNLQCNVQLILIHRYIDTVDT